MTIDTIRTIEELNARLRGDREVYVRALELFRSGQMKFKANNVDITDERIRSIEHIIAEIDKVLVSR